MIFFSTLNILRRPVLEQLQGRRAKGYKGGKTNFSLAQEQNPSIATFKSFDSLPSFEAKPQAGFVFKNACAFVLKHIVRSPAKSILGLFVALLFIMALAWLQETIKRTEDNIDYLFDNTIVRVEFYTDSASFYARERIEMLENSRYVADVARQANHNLAFVTNTRDGWEAIIGFGHTQSINYNIRNEIFNPLTGISDLDEFIDLHSVDLVGGEVLGLEIDFIDGFYATMFVYDDAELEQLVPLIISPSIAKQRGISIGDTVYIGYTELTMTSAEWHFVPVLVVGIHNQYTITTAFVPLDALENMIGIFLQYTDLRLTVDTAVNRDLPAARNYIERILVQTPWIGLWTREVHFLDEELRNVVAAMAQMLLLMELLYPVALVFAVIIGAVLSILLTLRLEKNAAVMRVLGMDKLKTRIVLCAENIVVCLGGLAVALFILGIMGWGFGVYELLLITGMYLGSAIVGSVVGAIIITAQSPLQLLQVRE